ncbi:MAG: UbiD family decarboxylase [bacterium]
MPLQNLEQTIKWLEERGELLRVREAVSPRFEMACFLDRLAKTCGPAVLFENVPGHSMPVLGNLYGSRERMAALLGVDRLENLGKKVEDVISIFDPTGPKSFLDKLKLLPKLKEITDLMPEYVKKGACQEVEWPEVDLRKLPALMHWPKDGGPFITMGLTFTRNPKTNVLNCGLYRLQVYGPRETGMHWQKHKGGADHAREAREKKTGSWDEAAKEPQPGRGLSGERLPVAVAIGADPVAVFCGAVPAPPDVNEMLIGGLLRGEPVKMVECRTIPGLHVPAESEIVLEGWIDPFETRLEGPFGDHTGYYSPAEPFPVFHVEHMTTRKNPVFLATLVGIPLMEDAWMGEAIVRFTLPIIKKQFPEIVDVCFPPWGVFHNLMIVSIRKSYPGHARKVMHGLWGLGQVMFTKTIIVVDHDVDLSDYAGVCFRVCASLDPKRDLEITQGPLDQLDHAGMYSCYGGKMGIDATTKWPEEGLLRPWPEILRHDPAAEKKVEELWRRLGMK